LGVQVPRALQITHQQRFNEPNESRTSNVDGGAEGGVVRGSGDDRSARRTGPVVFYRQVIAELRKVVWPTREQLVTYFSVVLVFVLFMMLLVSLLDLGFGKLMLTLFAGNKGQ
jgi:preprotein translocase subunit SecE